MRFDIITIFPEYFDSPLKTSLIGKALSNKLIEINFVNPRDFTNDKHRTVDDAPYGGGPGMLMKPEPIFKAVESVKTPDSKVIVLSASGRLYHQEDAFCLCKEKHLILICGHYEGIDERVSIGIADYEFSIGDYVLQNGNAAALVLIETISRLIPGVIGFEESYRKESFTENLLEYPQWTRPEDFRGMKVPEVLLSGDHAKIAKWRKEQAILKTAKNRADIFEKYKKINKKNGEII
ncbi:MAG TPA: tRNA (guanosine(37)-N1)-methyltransferase TrmD [Victivallales bacterium]|nr:tRNA (guanosine(37)-N1)-methyltransferase TrmD [Victivallales bacterium]HRR28276.1 tRNA (guanosine(37)-N1)-methyltransferase TrmD [Victivallales bacterium]HRU00361.1 tRNA (guanosine(37)-N1)-methyltransferase TrmD [Victivallales bacterium]